MALFARALPAALRTPALVPRRGMADAATAGKVVLTFASPIGALFAAKPVQQVNVPATGGDMGILSDHVPTIAVLRPGVVTVSEGDKESKFFVSSGTVTVNADSTVQILAEEAVPLDQLDAQAARRGLDSFNSQVLSARDDLARAQAEIGVEVHRAMCYALGV
eukprot:Opistho-1_new@10878